MARFLKVLFALALLASAAVAFAQEPLPPLPHNPNLFAQRWWRLLILDGRITVAPGQENQGTFKMGSVAEHFTVSTTANGTLLDYDLTAPNDKLSVHVEGAEQATIRRQVKPAASGAGGTSAQAPAETQVEYLQMPGKPIKLSVTANGQTRSVEGPTIWHLLLADPQLCNRHLVPILEVLRPNWRLNAIVDEVKQGMLKGARAKQGTDKQRFSGLVAELADDRYAVRQRAERQLRSAGRAALPYLQSLQRNELDAEQWRRVNEILAVYTEDGEDTADRIATRLLDDRAAWLTILADEDESDRRTAAERLSTIVGRPIDFDPAAAAETRAEQIAALRIKLLPNK